MRIGTWNLEGRSTRGHRDLLTMVDVDVWLLTEVNRGVSLPGFEAHATKAPMGERTHWAGVFSRVPLQPVPDSARLLLARDADMRGRLVQQHPAVALLGPIGGGKAAAARRPPARSRRS